MYTHRIVHIGTGVRDASLRFTSKAEAEHWLKSYQVSQQYKDANYRIVPDTPPPVTPPAVPSHPIELFRELTKLFLGTEASPLRIANVEFWIDAVGPFADTLSFSVPASNWDARAMGESVAQLARCYPEVIRIVSRFSASIDCRPR